jgi:hypothetical protein
MPENERSEIDGISADTVMPNERSGIDGVIGRAQ